MTGRISIQHCCVKSTNHTNINDMAVFNIQNVNENHGITRYQMCRYMNSNKAFCCILNFPIHVRDPNVIHLDVQLKTGQRICFKEQTSTKCINCFKIHIN